MASPTINRAGGDVVVRMPGSQVGMAACAGVGFVDRTGNFGKIHKQGDGLSRGVGPEESLIGMAIEAEAIGKRGGWRVGGEGCRRGA